MKKILILLITTTALAWLPLQAGWIKSYGGEMDESGNVIQQTADGGYIVFGDIISPAGSADMWLLKTDAMGDTQWTKTYGGPAPEYCYSGQQTSDGGYIIAGSTESFGEGKLDMWLVKTNSAGDTQWTKTYGGGGYDEAYSVQQTDDEGYIVTGTHDGLTDPWSGNMWLLKTDSDGDTMWTKTWAAASQTMTDLGNCVRQTLDDGYILACYADYSSTTRNGIVVMKTDDQGDTLWTYRDTIWFMTCVTLTTDDAYVATGYNNEDMFIIKLDSEGSLLWKKVYGDSRNNYRDFGFCVQASLDDGCVVAGGYSCFSGEGDVWLLKCDSDGDTTWTRTYGSSPQYDRANWVQPTSDGGYVMTGTTETWASAGRDLFIIKTDSAGNVAVSERPIAELEYDFGLLSPIGHEIVLKYSDSPDGFSASIFDASGRKVDHLHSSEPSGTITWGCGYGPGVYFFRVESGSSAKIHKAVLIR